MVVLVEAGGFGPPKRNATDLQSAPFGHSGTLPDIKIKWSWWTDSNPRPADYKSAALPTELHQRSLLNYYITAIHICQAFFENFLLFSVFPLEHGENCLD